LVNSHNVEISNNAFSVEGWCMIGIQSWQLPTSNNRIFNNLFSGFWGWASIALYSGVGNVIHHNDFIDCPAGIDVGGTCTWDDGNGEGNYWDDYTGADDGSNGRTAGDGVGDTDLPHNGVDNYPLMESANMDDAVDALIWITEDLNLDHGIENSLDQKLYNAKDSLEALNSDNRQDAVNKLEAFINAVDAQSGKKIPTDDANDLIAYAEWIIDNL
jgi:hypothetical protein